MSSAMAERYIDAAKDGYVDLLKEATKKDLNSPDEDGMTATIWAAHSGNLEALRLIVGRQGDVNMCDYLGQTPLHHATQRGHFDVVSYLVHYGCNLHSLDNDFHSALDIAAMHNRTDIVKFLDTQIAQRRAKNPKQWNKQKEEATRVADANIRRYEKLQEKAGRRAAKEQKRLSQYTRQLENEDTGAGTAPKPKGIFGTLAKSLRVRGKGTLQKQMAMTNTYSNMAGMTYSGSRQQSAVGRKLQNKRLETMSRQSGMQSGTVRSTSAADVMYRSTRVPGDHVTRQDDLDLDLSASRRPVLGHALTGGSKIYRAKSESDLLDTLDTDPSWRDDDDDGNDGNHTNKILNRQSVIGKMTFLPKHNFLTTVQSLEENSYHGNGNTSGSLDNDINKRLSGDGEEDNYNHMDERTSSLGLGHRDLPWNQDDLGDLEDDQGEGDKTEMSAIEMFVCACGLASYLHIFSKEKIDMQLLMDMTDSEFKELGLPFGPRKKLSEAITRRRAVLEVPTRMSASAL